MVLRVLSTSIGQKKEEVNVTESKGLDLALGIGITQTSLLTYLSTFVVSSL